MFTVKFATKISWLLYKITWSNNTAWTEILQNKHFVLQTPVWSKQFYPSKGMNQINKDNLQQQ